MRAYSVAVAALALEVDTKWLDNVLSHHTVVGIEKNRQGIQRKIPPDSLLILAIARALIVHLGVPIGDAVRTAHIVQRSRSAVAMGSAITVSVDVARIAAELNHRLADAVEGAAQRSRGRPSSAKRAAAPKI